MDKKLLDLLELIKHEKGFPPSERISQIKADLARRGFGTSPNITQIVRPYHESIEAVLMEFTDRIIKNADQLGLKSEVEMNDVVSKATEIVFKEGASYIARDYAWSEEYQRLAVSAIYEKLRPIKDLLPKKISLRKVILGELAKPLQVNDSSASLETSKRDFSFINDVNIRKILERDYSEIQRAYAAKCWKSVIILSGGAIEAILTDLLLQDPPKAKSATSAPKNSDITRWDLADLIKVCVELEVVNPGADKLSHSLREYRNLVHPGNEIRNKLIIDEQEATIAVKILEIVLRDLTSP